MRFGLVVPNRGPAALESVRRLPQVVEDLGFHSLWLTDHVIGVRSFQPVYGPEWLEGLTALSYVAARTSRIRIAFGVMVAPYRDPVMAAKILSTIDGLCDGRLDVGVGAGWSRSEFHALGKGDVFEERGRVTDEALEVITRCWQGGEFGFDGEFTRFRRIEFAPVPVQRPRPPIWIGGNTAPALRRAARFADVWHPTNLAPELVAEKGDELDRVVGRAIPRAVRLRVPPDRDVGELEPTIEAYAGAGCDHIVLEVDDADPGIVESWGRAFTQRFDHATT